MSNIQIIRLSLKMKSHVQDEKNAILSPILKHLFGLTYCSTFLINCTNKHYSIYREKIYNLKTIIPVPRLHVSGLLRSTNSLVFGECQPYSSSL